MPLEMVGRVGPGMRQAIGFGDRSTKGVILGVNLGRAIEPTLHRLVIIDPSGRVLSLILSENSIIMERLHQLVDVVPYRPEDPAEYDFAPAK